MNSYPKTYEQNLRFRKEIDSRAKQDAGFRKEIRAICKEDILFWVNTFCWLAEQREGGVTGNLLPFLSFDYQDDAFLRMSSALGHKIVVGDKSRDCGFTWIVLYLFLHRCQFFEGQSFAIASRSEELVWKPGSPDSLFWKLQFALTKQPQWLVGRLLGTKKHYAFPDTGSDIAGYATTKDIARGGRRLAILLDELAAFDFAEGMGAYAACESATNSIFAISTHQGNTGAFADTCASAKLYPDVYERIVVRWWMDPRKNKGLEWRKA